MSWHKSTSCPCLLTHLCIARVCVCVSLSFPCCSEFNSAMVALMCTSTQSSYVQSDSWRGKAGCMHCITKAKRFPGCRTLGIMSPSLATMAKPRVANVAADLAEEGKKAEVQEAPARRVVKTARVLILLGLPEMVMELVFRSFFFLFSHATYVR